MTIGIGLVGLGKIARDQHLPTIARTEGARLVAVATRNGEAEGVPTYRDLGAMLAAEPGVDAVVMCQPPQVRFEAARTAIEAGKHVFLEKPPGATLSEVEALIGLAKARGVTLFASWHSREAGGVAPARGWLARAELHKVAIAWKEDVRVWHPGQTWIWEPGGFGVFDPGINALSILTAILPGTVRLTAATLETPSNRQAPIAAQLTMQTAAGIPIAAEFDFRQTGPQSWDIRVETAQGELLLSHGGEALEIAGQTQQLAGGGEYAGLYRRFVELVRSGASDVELAPLRLVADAFLCGKRVEVAAFEE
ncbi:MAG: Gfo/Idh/MocA family oxidoreductase [Novosphingobium sp.]|nr:Gfo/Idh/MocA family oxidoreductase [Novosphingobium sp.]